MTHEGGCLCGAVRYSCEADPVRVTFCHCRFCQKATGSAYMVEPIFEKASFTLMAGDPKVYQHRSEGSGKIVSIHFCNECGTKLFLSFERFAGVIGVYAGTFEDPNWFERSGANAKHIFLAVAQNGSVIPAGIPAYEQHAATNDGEPITPTVFEHPHVI